MACHARTELISGAMRVWSDGDGDGDPWVYAVNVRALPGIRDGCELFLVRKAPTPEQRRAIGREVLRLGFSWFMSTKGDGTYSLYDAKTGHRIDPPRLVQTLTEMVKARKLQLELESLGKVQQYYDEATDV